MTKTPLQLARELQALQILEDGQSLNGLHHKAIRRRLTEELLLALLTEEAEADLLDGPGVFSYATAEAMKSPDAATAHGAYKRHVDEAARFYGAGIDPAKGPDMSGIAAFRLGPNGVEPMADFSGMSWLQDVINKGVIRPAPKYDVNISYGFCPTHGPEACTVIVNDAPLRFERDLDKESVEAFEARIIAAYVAKEVKVYLQSEFADLHRQWGSLKASGALNSIPDDTGVMLGGKATLH